MTGTRCDDWHDRIEQEKNKIIRAGHNGVMKGVLHRTQEEWDEIYRKRTEAQGGKEGMIVMSRIRHKNQGYYVPTKEDVITIDELYKQGLTVCKISKITLVPLGTAMNVAQRGGGYKHLPPAGHIVPYPSCLIYPLTKEDQILANKIRASY